MKKKVVIAVISFVLIAIFVGVAFFFWKDKKVKDAEGLCYVESVSVITGNGMTWNNRFMGIVETQEVTKVTRIVKRLLRKSSLKKWTRLRLEISCLSMILTTA